MTRTCPVCESSGIRRSRAPRAFNLARCVACGAWFVDPAPTDAELKAFYERQHAEGRTVRGPNEVELERRLELVVRHLRRPGARVLDVGTGSGAFVRAARRHGLNVAGCEVSLAAFSNRPEAFPAFVGSIDALRDDAGLDGICFWDVLEHVPRPAEVLREAGRRLCHGGIVAVSMPNHASTARALQGWRWPYYDFSAHGHLVHVSPGQMQTLLRRADLTPIYWETRGSVDLGSLPLVSCLRPRGAVGWIAGKLSGALARCAMPLGFGNTLLVLASRYDDTGH